MFYCNKYSTYTKYSARRTCCEIYLVQSLQEAPSSRRANNTPISSVVRNQSLRRDDIESVVNFALARFILTRGLVLIVFLYC